MSDLSTNITTNISQAEECGSDEEGLISERDIHLAFLVPATLLVVAMSFTQKRYRLWLGSCHGRPGLLIPMNTLEDRRDRLLYTAAFGLTINAILTLFDGDKNELPIVLDTSRYIGPLNIILSVMVYTVVYYPIFAAITLHNRLGYGIGTIYLYVLILCNILQTVPCDHTEFDAEYFFWSFASWRMPAVIFQLLLIVMMPVRFFQKWSAVNRVTNDITTTYDDEDEKNYHFYYVKKLFAKNNKNRKLKIVVDNLDNKTTKIKTKLGAAKKKIYHSSRGFKYSPRLLSSIAMGLTSIYVFAFLLIFGGLLLFVEVMQLFNLLRSDEGYAIIEEAKNEIIDPIRLHFELNFTITTKDIVSAISATHYHTWVVFVVYFVSVIIAVGFSIFHVLHFLRTHRNHLRLIHKGKFHEMGGMSNGSIISASLKFSGYQVAYMTWGFILHTGLFFLIVVILVEVVILPLVFGYPDLWLWPMLAHFGIPLAWSIVIVVVQSLLSRFVFLYDYQWLALNNRKIYFIMVYIMYFYNIVVGLISCLLRMLKSIIFGVWFISRLDHSTLSRLFENYDPGYTAYIGFLKLENAHTHPVVLAFSYMMTDVISKHCKEGESNSLTIEMSGISTVKEADKSILPEQDSKMINRRKVARNRWFVAITLLFNPALRFERPTNRNYMEIHGALGASYHFQDVDQTNPSRSDTHELTGDVVLAAVGLEVTREVLE